MTVVRLRELCKGYRQYARPLDSLKEVLLRRPLHTNVWALRGVNIDLERGQHLGVIGDNGAGKSTLMKVLSGAHAPDEGRMWLDGTPYQPANPLHARSQGVAMIYQETNLAPHLSIEENVMLGREPVRLGFLRRGLRRAPVREVVEHGRNGLLVDFFAPPQIAVERAAQGAQEAA